MPDSSATEIRDDIAAIQSSLDQARAYLNSNRHTLDEAMTSLMSRHMDDQQAKLDAAKAHINAHFPTS